MLRRSTVLAGAVAPLLATFVPTLACSDQSRAATPIRHAPAERGSPIADQGSSYHFRSYVTAIVPSFPGLQVEVLEFADRLVLRNHTGKTVTVYGYSGEPYARLRPDGTTEQNTRSPAVYLNTSFYANVTVPAGASASAPPAWAVVDRTGEFEWHDHRIHWMSPATPPEVKNPAKRTKIFDWRVPVRVGARSGAIDGVLFWVPEEGTKTPLAAIVALIAIALGGLAFALTVRRRRRSADGGPSPPAEEAW